MSANLSVLAAGLSKAQRAILLRLSDEWWRESNELVSLHHQRPAATAISLAHKGLAERRFHLEKCPTQYSLTPLGAALRQHLIERG